nr:hypothetical protein [Tanacetum cinerariifolium]
KHGIALVLNTKLRSGRAAAYHSSSKSVAASAAGNSSGPLGQVDFGHGRAHADGAIDDYCQRAIRTSYVSQANIST